jgi:mRNA-degrading endonuclease toxin of MazEF toxin-antitoxin module
LHISRDGYGYLLCEVPLADAPDSMRIDSVYVNNRKIRMYNLNNGDTIRATVFPSRNGSSPNLDEVLTQNGAEIPAPVAYDRPRHDKDMVVQMLYYFILALALMTIMTIRFDANNYTPKRYLVRSTATVIAAAITSRTGKTKLPTHIDIYADRVGLAKDSVILLEQIRTLDKRRLREKMGHLSEDVMEEVNNAIAVSFGLHEGVREPMREGRDRTHEPIHEPARVLHPPITEPRPSPVKVPFEAPPPAAVAKEEHTAEG